MTVKDLKDYAHEIVSQLGCGGKLDERITTEQAQQIIETALDNYAELRSSNVVGQSEQLKALKECRRWMINKGVNVESDFFKNIDKAINCD